jgi:hypothetical protein
MTSDEILVCIEGIVPVRSTPDPQSARVTELLFGDEFIARSEREGLVHGSTRADGVAGFVAREALAAKSDHATHRVRRTFIHVYPSPDLVAAAATILPMNALVAITGRSAPLRYPGGGPGSTVVQLRSGGWVTEQGLASLERFATDVRTVAAMFVGAVYLQGGRTWLGCDGPGLVQTVLAACGMNVPRQIAAQREFFANRAMAESEDRFSSPAGSVVYSDVACGFLFDDQVIAARPETMLVESTTFDEFSKTCAGPIRAFPLSGSGNGPAALSRRSAD